MFVRPVRISFLHFLGADDYFITETGMVWQRAKIRTNSYGYQTRGYQPLVIKDPAYPYPWVYLRTTAGLLWLPVNQILGWAFHPPQTTDICYFLAKVGAGILPMHLDNFHWTEETPAHPEGFYCRWMKALYQLF